MLSNKLGISGKPSPGSSRLSVGSVSVGNDGRAGSEGSAIVGMLSCGIGNGGSPNDGSSRFNDGSCGRFSAGSDGSEGTAIVGMLSDNDGSVGKQAIYAIFVVVEVN